MKKFIDHQTAALEALQKTNQNTDEFIKNVNELIGRDLNAKR